MTDLYTHTTITNGTVAEVTLDSIMVAVKEFERLQAECEQPEERVGCVVAPIEWFDGMPVVQDQSGPAAISGCPYVDIGSDRYVFDPEVYERIMSYRIDRNIPLQMDWKA